MKPVRPGDRGPAVEDIQRRLLALGHDLGPTGVDGVYLGQTEVAVRSFQSAHALSEDGYVGEQTWSTLVDEGFSLGDRMLYLRLPHFHGRDVRTLQTAVSVLGFACGEPDGIFGAFTERAVRELQRNAGLPSDGIVGAETVRVLRSLRHVWHGKESRSHSEARVPASRPIVALSRIALAVGGLDEGGMRVAGRMVNLAMAAEPTACIALLEEGVTVHGGTKAVLWIQGAGPVTEVPGRPIVRLDHPEALESRLITAVSSVHSDCPEVVVELGGSTESKEHEEQRAAVLLLDAVCVAFD